MDHSWSHIYTYKTWWISTHQWNVFPTENIQNTNTNLKFPRKYHVSEIKWCWAISISLREKKNNYFQIRSFSGICVCVYNYNVCCWPNQSDTIHIFLKVLLEIVFIFCLTMCWRHTGKLTIYLLIWKWEGCRYLDVFLLGRDGSLLLKSMLLRLRGD